MRPYRTALFDNSRWAGFEPRPGDVFVCTPPKCGTTWTQTIIANLFWPDGNLPGPVMQISPWIEALFLPADAVHAMLRAQDFRRVMKSHTPADGIPWFPDAKYVFVARDGRDAFMSLANHMDRMKCTEMLNEQARSDGIEPMPGQSCAIVTWVVVSSPSASVMEGMTWSWAGAVSDTPRTVDGSMK